MLSNQSSQTNSEMTEELITHVMEKIDSYTIQQTGLHKVALDQRYKIRVNPGFRRTPQAPVYPAQAIRLYQQGTTLIRAKISRFGDIRKICIHRSSGIESLDLAAMAAVREWKFVPDRVNGVTIASWVQVPVNFVLK